MKRFYGFLVLDAQMTVANKVNFIWSLVIPLFIALIFKKTFLDSINSSLEMQNYLTWFVIYIIMSSYLYGIGLKLARFRDSGILKSYILIAGSKSLYLYALLLNQIIFCLFSLTIFNVVMSLIYNLSILKTLTFSIILLICSIPIAYGMLFLPILPLKDTTINPLLSIGIYALFIIAINTKFTEYMWVEWLNPFTLLYTLYLYSSSLVLKISDVSMNPIPFMLLAVYILIGYLSSRHINLVSRTER